MCHIEEDIYSCGHRRSAHNVFCNKARPPSYGAREPTPCRPLDTVQTTHRSCCRPACCEEVIAPLRETLKQMRSALDQCFDRRHNRYRMDEVYDVRVAAYKQARQRLEACEEQHAYCKGTHSRRPWEAEVSRASHSAYTRPVKDPETPRRSHAAFTRSANGASAAPGASAAERFPWEQPPAEPNYGQRRPAAHDALSNQNPRPKRLTVDELNAYDDAWDEVRGKW